MTEPTPYDLSMFDKFQTLEPYRWYLISPDRPDREEFIQAIKRYIDAYGTAELNKDCTRFRFIWTVKTQKWLEMNKGGNKWI